MKLWPTERQARGGRHVGTLATATCAASTRSERPDVDALLATLKAVFTDGSTPVVSSPTVQPLALAQFTAGHILIECVNEDGSAHSLAYDTLIFGVRQHPTDATPAISVQRRTSTSTPMKEIPPTIGRASSWCRATGCAVPPRLYGYDVVALVNGDPDDRLPVVPHSLLKVTPENVHPGDNRAGAGVAAAARARAAGRGRPARRRWQRWATFNPSARPRLLVRTGKYADAGPCSPRPRNRWRRRQLRERPTSPSTPMGASPRPTMVQVVATQHPFRSWYPAPGGRLLRLVTLVRRTISALLSETDSTRHTCPASP
jgi:hypothetical protein